MNTPRTLINRSLSPCIIHHAPRTTKTKKGAIGLPRHHPHHLIAKTPIARETSSHKLGSRRIVSTANSSSFSFPYFEHLQHRRRISSMATNGAAHELRFKNPAILVCDIQEKFQTAIHEFDKIVLTTQKLLTFAKTFSIPIHATTQTVAKLGPTVPSLASLLPSTPHDKTKFSMHTPSLAAALSSSSSSSYASVALVGIETHICITQTALDLRDAGHRVYVIADGVSSCNPGEVIVALDRLRAEPGITVTTSESWMYECVGDASHPGFKGLIGVVKSSMADTKNVLRSLPPTKI